MVSILSHEVVDISWYPTDSFEDHQNYLKCSLKKQISENHHGLRDFKAWPSFGRLLQTLIS